jgi:hypothetical protein
MRRDQLEHAIRTACQIIGRHEVIVVGSQSILGTFREDQLPADATTVARLRAHGTVSPGSRSPNDAGCPTGTGRSGDPGRDVRSDAVVSARRFPEHGAGRRKVTRPFGKPKPKDISPNGRAVSLSPPADSRLLE